jgi:hypothetical protein
VQCSWDEGEKDRERKLTNISQWRQLAESELLQYVASSDSDDDDEEDEENEGGDSENDSDGSERPVAILDKSRSSKRSTQRKET